MKAFKTDNSKLIVIVLSSMLQVARINLFEALKNNNKLDFAKSKKEIKKYQTTIEQLENKDYESIDVDLLIHCDNVATEHKKYVADLDEYTMKPKIN